MIANEIVIHQKQSYGQITSTGQHMVFNDGQTHTIKQAVKGLKINYVKLFIKYENQYDHV